MFCFLLDLAEARNIDFILHQILRISKEGKIVGEIKYPAKCITCPVFVGTELWVTSADDGDEGVADESKKFGGGVFRVDVGVRGKEPFKFSLDPGVLKL